MKNNSQLAIPCMEVATTGKSVKNFKKEWINGGAFFSHDRSYRYWLFRGWDESLPLMMFIGLNPSTANENTDDPTIRKVVKFARSWGYGGVYMMNLFAIISSDPKILLTAADPLGANDKFFDDIAPQVKDVLFAWGAFDVNGRDKEIIARFPGAYCLGVNKDGSPKHPLYIPASMILTLFSENYPVK